MKAAQEVISHLFAAGYAATDIIQTLFRVTRAHEIPGKHIFSSTTSTLLHYHEILK